MYLSPVIVSFGYGDESDRLRSPAMMPLGDLSRGVHGSPASWLLMCGCLAESIASATRWLVALASATRLLESIGCECCIARGDERAGRWLLGCTEAGRWRKEVGGSATSGCEGAVDGGGAAVSRQYWISSVTGGHLLVVCIM
tara:strand:- start:175 stop:600 length:426 start_codon:yes stop_codon:yes gene_type:complete